MVQMTKMVLFAQLTAVLSSGGGSTRALGQVIPLLVLTALYWAYMRIVVPMSRLVDLFGEVRPGWAPCRRAHLLQAVCHVLCTGPCHRPTPVPPALPPGPRRSSPAPATWAPLCAAS